MNQNDQVKKKIESTGFNRVFPKELERRGRWSPKEMSDAIADLIAQRIREGKTSSLIEEIRVVIRREMELYFKSKEKKAEEAKSCS